ncbi:MAG TPA: cardiolipin synthase [Erysipelotrichaceae bacterium]|jgi:cardiolipin synthase|nr:cardiolipin synthase [Erysipelotrichaceae bacterium]
MEQNEDIKVTKLVNKVPRIGRILFSWTSIIIVLLIIGVLAVFSVFQWFYDWLSTITAGIFIFDILVIIYLVNSKMDSSGKITWLLIISAIPVIGALLYMYTRLDFGFISIKSYFQDERTVSRDYINEDNFAKKELKKLDSDAGGTAAYVSSTGNYPVFQNTSVKYYPLGEYKWQDMLKDLEKAQKFIFLEYFIIGEGLMWGSILHILAEKVKAGVEVRVMYDGTCEFTTLPHNYPERLKKLGIQCKMFSPLTPILSTSYNYRDHRKILVIDNQIAYNGGVNLADEYINHIERFGHWKDTAIRLEGDAVQSFTMMFLEMWNLTEHEVKVAEYMKVKPVPVTSDGYVMPYADTPFDDFRTGESVYMDLLYQAGRYVHIMTPYLILDDEMVMALRTAALKGIDVRIILPGIPDKKVVYQLAKTYFRILKKAGVRIYTYTPGFVHAKVFVSDDIKAVVGTINLDFRSLYHHFECATYLYGSSCIADIEQDFMETLEKCHEVTDEEVYRQNLFERGVGRFARMVAPML